MNCRRIHDVLHDLFGHVDSAEFLASVIKACRADKWSSLLGFSDDRDHALQHVSECSCCLDDLCAYLEIRDTVDYRDYPCLHLAYYSTQEDVKCIENDYGFFSIVLSGKEAVGVGIGCCPWCGVPFPTSHAEMIEAREIGFRSWQQKQ